MHQKFPFAKGILSSLLLFCCPVLSIFAQPSAPKAAPKDIIDASAKPTVFLQEGVSVPNNESVPTFTPDGNTVYFADNYRIGVSKKVKGKWTKPTPTTFSGQWKNWDPALTMDGKRLLFVSNRPWTDKKTNHLWYCDRLAGDAWSEPKHMDAPLNVDGAPTYAPSISPDERYIIFASDNLLYISYRQHDGWSAGQKLGAQVNDGGGNGGPYVSPDGKTLYYSSSKTDGIMMIPVHIRTSPIKG